MHDELVALATHDAEMVRARHDLEHPASGEALEGLDAELTGLRRDKRELDAAREPLAARAAVLERDATGARARAADLQARLRSATGAGRELEAMSKEADALVRRASRIEDELLDVLAELEPLDQRDAKLRARHGDATSRRAEVAAAVEAERAGTAAVLARLESERPALLAALDEPTRARYEYAAGRAGGVGAARLVDGRCGVCRVTVPSAVADHLLRGGDEELVVVCDECGRLLVR